MYGFDLLPGAGPQRYALLRYNSAMATIQVREIPEDLYEVLRRRARRSGQSLQAYMHDQVVALAQQPTKQEAVEEIEAVLARVTSEEPGAALVLADLAAERP
jgi:antitoxin FitA